MCTDIEMVLFKKTFRPLGSAIVSYYDMAYLKYEVASWPSIQYYSGMDVIPYYVKTQKGLSFLQISWDGMAQSELSKNVTKL